MLLLGFIHIRFPQVKHLSTHDLAVWLESPESDQVRQEDRPKPVLLDVRTPEEYQVSHLFGAQLAPANKSDLAAIATSETPIVTYCSVGYRSAKLALALQQAGYHQVFNLEGSLFQWVNEGRSVYRKDQVVRQVHPYNWFWYWFLQLPPAQK
jgi:rhodanese-related sulfurtransferase